MEISLTFASTEGQTAKIAEFVERRMAENGHRVTCSSADVLPDGYALPAADLFVIAASLHAGHFQASIVRLIEGNLPALNTGPSAFFAVSLSAAGDAQDIADADERVQSLCRQTGWSPTMVEHIAGAFRFTRYDYFKRLALKYIAYRKGQPTDTSRDYELTDWERLRAFVDRIAPPAGDAGLSQKRV